MWEEKPIKLTWIVTRPMLFTYSQPLAALSALRPSTGRLRVWPLQLLASLWIWTLSACGVPGPEAMPAQIARIRRFSLPATEPGCAFLSYLQAGDSKGRRVIFVHGTPGSAEGWADFLLNVPPGLEYVALDRPGFGRSSPEEALVPLPDQAAEVARLLVTRAGHKPILVGHSLGGAIIAWLAAAQPDAVAGMVIVAGAVDPRQERLHPLQILGDTRPVRIMLPRAMRNANHELMGLKPWLEKLHPMLSQIRVPVWILHGTRDRLVPLANVAYLRENLTGSKRVTVELLEGVSHFLPWNSRPRIEALILQSAEMANSDN
jgi:pimeloyl-ACP methyl ester carboxylesterase